LRSGKLRRTSQSPASPHRHRDEPVILQSKPCLQNSLEITSPVYGLPGPGAGTVGRGTPGAGATVRGGATGAGAAGRTAGGAAGFAASFVFVAASIRRVIFVVIIVTRFEP